VKVLDQKGRERSNGSHWWVLGSVCIMFWMRHWIKNRTARKPSANNHRWRYFDPQIPRFWTLRRDGKGLLRSNSRKA
jgi:hypothetical protein